MKRTLQVGSVVDEETGISYFDRDGAERLIQFVLDNLEYFGGAWSIVADRTEIAPGQFRMEGLIAQYESFAPARREPQSAVEPAPDTEVLQAA
jgi:hypothetical protein